MKNHFKFGLAAVLLAMVVLLSPVARADSTDVLPKGRSMVNISDRVVDVSREFDKSGHDRELGYYFNNQDITGLATPFFNLYLIGLGFPIPPNMPGTVNLAITSLDAKVEANAMGFSYSYGLTDDVTLAVGFPYYTWVRTDANFKVDLYPNTVMFPMLPTKIDMTEEAQEIIHQQFGYDYIKDWTGGSGIGDLQAGAKWRFLNTDYLKAATGLGVRFPTGRIDDERNLTDVAYGQGGYDAQMFAMMDLTPAEWLMFNFTGRYTYSLPFDRAVYILDKNEPDYYEAELPSKRVSGEFDRGDYFELEHETRVTLVPGVKVFGGMSYLQSQSDTIDGDLAPNTVKLSRTVFAGLEVSSVEAYQAGTAAVPMSFILSTDAVQTGKNVEKPKSAIMSLSFYF